MRSGLLRRGVAVLFVGCLVAMSLAAPTAGQKGRSTLRVLFIGNSFTFYNDLPSVVAALAESVPEAPKIEVRMVASGGYTLERHWGDRSTRSALQAGSWDVVVLQEQSRRPIVDRVRMSTYAGRFAEVIDAAGARTVLFMTWARHDSPGDIETIAAAYRAVAGEHAAEVAPVGEAWRRALEQRPGLALHAPDGIHPSAAGTYLAANVLFARLTGPEPTGAGTALGLDLEVAGFLRDVAARSAFARSQELSTSRSEGARDR